MKHTKKNEEKFKKQNILQGCENVFSGSKTIDPITRVIKSSYNYKYLILKIITMRSLSITKTIQNCNILPNLF